MPDPMQRYLSVGQIQREVVPDVGAVPAVTFSDERRGSLAGLALPSAGGGGKGNDRTGGIVSDEELCHTHPAPTSNIGEVEVAFIFSLIKRNMAV